MADTKISALASATLPLAGTEVLPIVQGGATVKVAASDIADDVRSEVVEARAGRSTLGRRIDTVSNFASPNSGGIVIGNYYDNAFHATASSTLTGAANRTDLAPFYASQDMRVDRLALIITTAVASSQVKCVIYSATLEGWPDALLYETAALDGSATGLKEETVDFTFEAGRQYWVGSRHSSTAALRTINISSAVNLGTTSGVATTYNTIIRRTATFATASADPWVFNAAELTSATPPSVRFRARSLT